MAILILGSARVARKHVPVVFWWPRGAPNQVPVHFLKLWVTQARGLEHPESARIRQVRCLKLSNFHFERLVRGVCTFATQGESAGWGPEGDKCEHSSREKLKIAFGAPPEQLQTMCLRRFRAKGAPQSTYPCRRRNQEMHRYMVWSVPKAPKCGRHML